MQTQQPGEIRTNRRIDQSKPATVDCLQDGGALLPERRRGAPVHRRRGHEADAGVAVLVVVPGEELARMRSGVPEALAARGKLVPVLEGLEMRLRETVHTIYHAAAYKHVPLVEDNAVEGIRNNVIGTLRAAEAAIAAKVETFVLVSTDKAVRPTNIMGKQETG